jgi:periplasmic protein TonB
MPQLGIFADCILQTSSTQRSRRSWTTLTSFGLQAVAISLLLLFPLLETVGLPANRTLPTPISWGAPPPSSPPLQRHQVTTMVSNLADNRIIAPREIPRHVAMIAETAAPPQVSFGRPGVEGGTGGGSDDGILGALNDLSAREIPLPAPAPKPATPMFRTSSILEGSLIRRVQPVYPVLARSARIQGAVVLQAIISKEGSIENLRAVSGHPMLIPAAIEAVRQWRYRPYILNHEPIEVETQITVNFTLEN